MNEIKGRFIILSYRLMSLYKDARQEANAYLYSKIGKQARELDPEGWYDTRFFSAFIAKFVEASPTGEHAMLTVGQNIYPEIEASGGLPRHLKTPLDYIKFESEGYCKNLRGPDIKPRKFIQEKDGHIIVQTVMKEQHCKILEGVYLGILTMAGTNNGKVMQTSCRRKGDEFCEFHITYEPFPFGG